MWSFAIYYYLHILWTFITHSLCLFVMKIDSCGKNGLVRLQLFLCGLCVPVLMTRGLWRMQRAWSCSAPIPSCCCPSLGHEGLLCSVRLSSLSRDTWPNGDLAVCAVPTQVWEHLIQLSMLTFSQFFDLSIHWDLWKGHWKTIGSVILTSVFQPDEYIALVLPCALEADKKAQFESAS